MTELQTTINEPGLQPTTSLVETTGLVEQKPLNVFSTITVVACILRAICWFLGCHEAKCSGYGEEKAAPNPMTDHLNSSVAAVPSEGL